MNGVDEAGTALRLGLHADVEPNRRVEGHLLVHEEVGQLSLEGGEVLVRVEVVLGEGPGGDRVDHPIDELLDAALTTGRADMAAEVLADHDVGGELRPEVGNLYVRLLEDGLARLVLDLGRAELPGDFVVGVNAGGGPAPLEGQSAGAGSGETPFVVDGPDDRLQGSVPRKHLGSVISRGVGCAGCCPGHFHTLPTLHIPFITGPGTAGAQSPNARFRPTRCQGQNHNMWGSDHDANHNSLCLGGRRRKSRRGRAVGHWWSVWGSRVDAVGSAARGASQGSHM